MGRPVELTEHQRERLDMLRAIRQPVRFVGAAGTGKSTVAVQLPDLLGWSARTVFAAPTHTALRVLQGKAESMGLSLRTSTTTALLWGAPAILHCRACPPSARNVSGARGVPECAHLTPGRAACPYEGTSQACGQQDYTANTPRQFWDDWDNVIVDEASMLIKKDYDALLAGAEHLTGRLVLVGDHCQLPPVYTEFERKRASVPEGWGCLTHEDLPEVRLTEPLRQAGGQVLTGARAVRDVIEGGSSPRGAHVGTLLRGGLADADESTRLLHAPGVPREWVADAVRRVANALPEPTWQDFAMVVHTNAQRQAWNAFARQLAGRPADRPAAGDVLISAEKFAVRKEERGPLAVTKWERGVVTEVVRAADPDFCADTGCHCGGRDRDALRYVIRLLIEGQESPVIQCVSMAELGAERGKQTRWWWGYAMTVHAAQGAGWPHVVYQDSSAFPDPKRVYTAATRASRSLLVFDTAAAGKNVDPIPAWLREAVA